MIPRLYYLVDQKLRRQSLRRQPEMDIVMRDEEQDLEYSRDGEEGSLAVLYDFVINSVLRLAPESGRALDIASGSGQLLAKLAKCLPSVQFVGTDLSAHMLRIAERNAERYGATNVRFQFQDMYKLKGMVGGPFDLITWSLGLHHCESAHDVRRVFEGIASLLAPRGSLYIFDIVRPKTGDIAVILADLYNRSQGSWFYHDSLDSYKAAFTFAELDDILRGSPLRQAHHQQPAIANFFQSISIAGSGAHRRPTVSHLSRLWQKRDYHLLNLGFKLNEWIP